MAGNRSPDRVHELADLLRPDGSVIVPAEVARDVLRLLVLGLSARVRADGGQLSPLARRLLHALHKAAERPPTSPGEPAPTLATIAEAAERMGCSPSYVRRLARRGLLPARRAGGTWLVAVPNSEPEAEPPAIMNV